MYLDHTVLNVHFTAWKASTSIVFIFLMVLNKEKVKFLTEGDAISISIDVWLFTLSLHTPLSRRKS